MQRVVEFVHPRRAVEGERVVKPDVRVRQDVRHRVPVDDDLHEFVADGLDAAQVLASDKGCFPLERAAFELVLGDEIDEVLVRCY